VSDIFETFRHIIDWDLSRLAESLLGDRNRRARSQAALRRYHFVEIEKRLSLRPNRFPFRMPGSVTGRLQNGPISRTSQCAFALARFEKSEDKSPEGRHFGTARRVLPNNG